MTDKQEEEEDIMAGVTSTLMRISAAVARRPGNLPQITPRLVCVSKTKPANLILDAYEAGQRHFGENYANELNDKATDNLILEKCKDIQWHFIGHLQTNKINKVLGSPGLFMVETVHSVKLADNLDKHWPKFVKNEGEKLKVMIQVNTSGEDVKNGVEPSEVTKVARHILDKCPNLDLKGLMTIGQYGFDCTQGPNPDFLGLVKSREELCTYLKIDISEMELSMGMSSDFEHAIELGATNVRVGSTIFGARAPKTH